MHRRVFLGTLSSLVLNACLKDVGVTPLEPGALWPSAEIPELRSGQLRQLGVDAPSLVNFWATWCPPCRAEMMSLNQLFLDYQGRGLAVAAASIDDDVHLVREFLLQVPLAFPIYLDRGGKLAKGVFRVSVFPTTFLVDRGRVVRSVWVGERDWGGLDIRRSIDRVLAG